MLEDPDEVVEPLELEVVTEALLLVVGAAVVETPPQTMFKDTGNEVAYMVGLAPELAAEEA